MHPLFFSFGNFHLYWLSVCIVIGWLVFSFLFWRSLRRVGINEDTTFDLTFYATLVGIVTARIAFIVFHTEIFADKSLLLAFALWVAPGLSWVGGFVGSLATVVLLSRQYKVRLGQVLDALVAAFPLAYIIGSVGTFLDGAQKARISFYPVELYAVVGVFVLSIVFIRVRSLGEQNKWPYGIVSVWFILCYSLLMFLIEFVKESRVYFGNITANQWVYIALVAECVGVLYVRGGGREKMRPLFRLYISKSKKIGERIYAKLSKTRP